MTSSTTAIVTKPARLFRRGKYALNSRMGRLRREIFLLRQMESIRRFENIYCRKVLGRRNLELRGLWGKCFLTLRMRLWWILSNGVLWLFVLLVEGGYLSRHRHIPPKRRKRLRNCLRESWTV